MFACCQNNPVVYIDPDGLCREVGALLTWIDCKKSSCPTSRYYVKNEALRKACDTFHALCSNIELSAGVGQGLYYETEILEMVGVQLGMYGNQVEFQIRDGNITWGQSNNTVFSLSLMGYNFGTYDNHFTANDGTVEQSSNNPFNSDDMFIYSDDTLTIASVAIYPVVAGFSCELGFDIIQFCEDIRKIY